VTPVTPPRGWRRLHLTFHVLFISALIALVALGVWTDQRGYQQVRLALQDQLQASSDAFARDLTSVEGRTALAALPLGSAERVLRPILTKVRERVLRASAADEYLLGKTCYLKFAAQALEPLEVCAALSTPDNEPSTLPAARGDVLYVMARFASATLAPYGGWGTPPTRGDHFRLEIVPAAGAARRWILVAQRYSPQELLAALGATREPRTLTAPPPAAYALLAYPADARWHVAALLMRRADGRVSGSLVGAEGTAGERQLSLALDVTARAADGEPWPAGTPLVAVRLAHYRGAKSGEVAQPLAATYEERGGPVRDLPGTPLIPFGSLYRSAGLGETITLLAVHDSERNTQPGSAPAQPALWSAHFAAAGPLSMPPTAWSPHVAWVWRLGWRRPWLDDSDVVASSAAQPAFGYRVRATVPGRVALAEWNRFVPRLALSFLAVLLLVAALYAVTMRAVLGRLMQLAAAVSWPAGAAGAGSRARVQLPYVAAADEFGILARRLTHLLEREHADAERRARETQERVKREYATLRVIGHHIRSPIQALLALNPPASSSWPYIERINKAVQAVFGGDALRDAFSRIYGEAVRVDLAQFLVQLAANAERIGVRAVHVTGADRPVFVAVDDGALADAIVQALNNANRYRTPGTPIVMALSARDGRATLRIENEGPPIAPQNLEDIFQFGVSIGTDAPEHQGQGLFVARELVARMHGTIRAENLPRGVAIEIVLPVVP